MGQKRYKAEQIIGKLRQAEVCAAEGKRVAEILRELGITEQTYYRRRRETSEPRAETEVRGVRASGVRGAGATSLALAGPGAKHTAVSAEGQRERGGVAR